MAGRDVPVPHKCRHDPGKRWTPPVMLAAAPGTRRRRQAIGLHAGTDLGLLTSGPATSVGTGQPV